MSQRISAGATRRAQRRAAAERARKRRRITLGAVAFVALVAVGAVAVSLLMGSDSASAGSLYRFQTQDFHALVFDPTDADTLYFGHHHGMKESTDGGKTWNDTIVSGVDAMQLAIPTSDPQRRYVAGHLIFVRSDDGGRTWEQPAPNLPDLDLHGFAAAPSDPLRLYTFALGVRGFFTSADGGDVWEERTLPSTLTTGIMPLAVSADDPLHLFAGGGTELAESRDGGITWEASAGPGGLITALALAPTEPEILYAATIDGLFQRTGEGTWEKMPVSASGTILALAVSPSMPERIAAVDQSGHFYRSDDGGQTWATGK